MSDKTNLPYLLKLVDDESIEVRDNVLTELSNYGSSLEVDIKEFSNFLDTDKIDLIQPIIDASRRTWLKEKWIQWQKIENEYLRIEKASLLIARFQYGLNENVNVSDKLNELTQKFIQYHPHGDELKLAQFLFNEERILGERHDFYNPLNSNLFYSLDQKKGIPITLAIIYMLIGKRLSMNIVGCNFPGHFLSKFEIGNKTTYIDAFNNGRVIKEDELKELLKDSYESMNMFLKKVPTSNMIIRRIVQNLINAYKENNDQPNRYLFADLLASTPLS
jgi:hypothetical protein